MTISSLLITVLRIVLGSILLIAGVTKLANFGAFIYDVAGYQMLPSYLIKPTCYILVSTEITLGTALCFGYFSRGAGLLSALLFLIFSVALANVLLRELPLSDCGCGNYLFSLLDYLGLSVSTTPNWKMIFVDILLAIVCIGVVFSPQQGYGLDSLIRYARGNDPTG